jgi:ribonuclease T1
MKLSSWKQVSVYLFVFVAVFVAYSFASGNFNFGCVPAPSNQAENSATTSYQQDQKEDVSGQINVSDLPSEALDTLQLIKRGGPFPYSKDGTVFSNYEGLLPKKSQGYYHEYTVITPGSPDRGARRIVAGDSGEYYYTNDHYRSFKRITE